MELKGTQTEKNLLTASEYRSIEILGGQETLADGKEAVIVIPYNDRDNDSKVDGTNIDEETLEIFCYDEIKSKWVKESETTVDTENN